MSKEAQAAIQECMDRMRLILENVDHLFSDIEELIFANGFETLHSGYQSDLSKTSAVGVMPRHLSGFYGLEVDTAGDSDTLSVSVILTDNEKRGIEPLLFGGVIRPRSTKMRYVAWWPAEAVLGNLEKFLLPDLPREAVCKRGYAKSTADYWFAQAIYFTLPLTDINDRATAEQQFVQPLLSLYETVNAIR